MITPQSIFDYDMETHQATLLKKQEVLGGYDPTQYVSERQWATARDGTKVPLSIVYKKGFRRNGSAPLFLYVDGALRATSDPLYEQVAPLGRFLPSNIALTVSLGDEVASSSRASASRTASRPGSQGRPTSRRCACAAATASRGASCRASRRASPTTACPRRR